MVGNYPHIYIVDKSIKFGKDFRFGTLFQKKYSPTLKSTPDVFWRHKNEEEYFNHILNFSFSGPIYTKFGLLT